VRCLVPVFGELQLSTSQVRTRIELVEPWCRKHVFLHVRAIDLQHRGFPGRRCCDALVLYGESITDKITTCERATCTPYLLPPKVISCVRGCFESDITACLFYLLPGKHVSA
jgi:hypothetical protein